MIIGGKSKFNGILVTEITVKNMPGQHQSMEAVYALGELNEKEGKLRLLGTHGRCMAYPSNWSENTMKLLDELISSMEEDLLPRHFEVNAGMEDGDEGIKSGEDEEAGQI